jgi:hypothetical protein
LCINLKFEKLGFFSKIWGNVELIGIKWVEQHRLPKKKDEIMVRRFQQNQRRRGYSGRPWGCMERWEILIFMLFSLLLNWNNFQVVNNKEMWWLSVCVCIYIYIYIKNRFKDRPLKGKKNRGGELMTSLWINWDVLL